MRGDQPLWHYVVLASKQGQRSGALTMFSKESVKLKHSFTKYLLFLKAGIGFPDSIRVPFTITRTIPLAFSANFKKKVTQHKKKIHYFAYFICFRKKNQTRSAFERQRQREIAFCKYKPTNAGIKFVSC